MTYDRALPRAERLRMPWARDVALEVAKQHGVCIRPVALKRIDTTTGQSEIIDVPCGATLEAVCPPCAKRNRQLRMAQCREGWHLDQEPAITPDEPNDEQRWLVEFRADMQARRDAAEQAGDDTTDLDAVLAGLDDEINAAGMRGHVLGRTTGKRTRSTRRRQDAPDLPRRKMANTTLGRTFTGSDGKVYRPSLFVTLTLPSYGRVRDGVPVDPDTYDYARAARDALHFSKLVDRFVQNLRRVAGYDVQYFAAVEPQKRLAPHLHMAIRGTLPRAEIKQIAAATYHQVWWPPVDQVVFDGERLPVWEQGAGYLDPDTGEVLPTWDQALDRLDGDEDAEPLHVIRFGDQVDVKGVLSGTPDADQCIRYLSKYLTKSLGQSLDGGQAQREHAARFVDALRFEPCSPTCANWLRYGIQPKGAKAGMTPGRCRSKAHKPEHLGYAGRRVLVSRKWSKRPSPNTSRTAVPGSWKPSARPANRSTHTAMSGGPSRPETPTCPRWPSVSCAPWPNANDGAPTWPSSKPKQRAKIFRQIRERREGGEQMDQLLTVHEAADVLHTSVRFIRRLISQRRIEFVKVGRHVRIRESALVAFVLAGTVAPLTSDDITGRAA